MMGTVGRGAAALPLPSAEMHPLAGGASPGRLNCSTSSNRSELDRASRRQDAAARVVGLGGCAAGVLLAIGNWRDGRCWVCGHALKAAGSAGSARALTFASLWGAPHHRLAPEHRRCANGGADGGFRGGRPGAAASAAAAAAAWPALRLGSGPAPASAGAGPAASWQAGAIPTSSSTTCALRPQGWRDWRTGHARRRADQEQPGQQDGRGLLNQHYDRPVGRLWCALSHTGPTGCLRIERAACGCCPVS